VIAVTEDLEKKDLIAPDSDYPDAYDPHVWGDPMLWSQCVESVVDGLTKVDPENAEQYRSAGASYQEQLKELHQWGLDQVAQVEEKKRVLLTSHDAFGYYARAFGFSVEGLEGVSTQGDASLKRVRELVSFIKERNITTVFSETAVNSKGMAALARDAGIKLSEEKLYADATGEDKQETRGGETYNHNTYLGMVKHNINAIVSELK